MMVVIVMMSVEMIGTLPVMAVVTIMVIMPSLMMIVIVVSIKMVGVFPAMGVLLISVFMMRVRPVVSWLIMALVVGDMMWLLMVDIFATVLI